MFQWKSVRYICMLKGQRQLTLIIKFTLKDILSGTYKSKNSGKWKVISAQNSLSWFINNFRLASSVKNTLNTVFMLKMLCQSDFIDEGFKWMEISCKR